MDHRFHPVETGIAFSVTAVPIGIAACFAPMNAAALWVLALGLGCVTVVCSRIADTDPQTPPGWLVLFVVTGGLASIAGGAMINGLVGVAFVLFVGLFVTAIVGYVVGAILRAVTGRLTSEDTELIADGGRCLVATFESVVGIAILAAVIAGIYYLVG